MRKLLCLLLSAAMVLSLGGSGLTRFAKRSIFLTDRVTAASYHYDLMRG